MLYITNASNTKNMHILLSVMRASKVLNGLKKSSKCMSSFLIKTHRIYLKTKYKNLIEIYNNILLK